MSNYQIATAEREARYDDQWLDARAALEQRSMTQLEALAKDGALFVTLLEVFEMATDDHAYREEQRDEMPVVRFNYHERRAELAQIDHMILAAVKRMRLLDAEVDAEVGSRATDS